MEERRLTTISILLLAQLFMLWCIWAKIGA